MPKFKKKSKKEHKTSLYEFFKKPPKGNSVVCIAKKVNNDKQKLLKHGDVSANETLYLCGEYDDEIDLNESEFAISREKFCADFIHYVDPNCSPAYQRFEADEGEEPFIGSDFIPQFISWKKSYDYQKQTILGYRFNEDGAMECSGQTKKIRGLGKCAVLLLLLGKSDRGNTNWGLVEKSQHLQVTLIDFGQCLNEMQFSKEPLESYSNPFDMVKAVFQQYAHTTEYPLPIQFLQSPNILCELFETIEFLHHLSFEVIERMADENFAQCPKYKSAILHDLKMGIEHLHNQFKNNPEYTAINWINTFFKNMGAPFQLSDFDNKSILNLLKMHGLFNPQGNALKEELLSNHLRSLLNIEQKEAVNDNESGFVKNQC